MSIDDIRNQLDLVYDGFTWYGKNIQSTLAEIPIGKALLRLDGSYNIAELVSHMLAWRNYTIKLLETGQHYKMPEVENFPTIEVMMMEDWNILMDHFTESQYRLMALLSSEVDLQKTVPGKSHTTGDVVAGLIQHDIYHAGQINLLAKFL